MIGKCKGLKELQTRALDRIIDIEEMAKKGFEVYQGMNFDTYFSECLGVTRAAHQRPMKVIFKTNLTHTDYLRTKPLHHSQQILKENETGTTFRIYVIINFELEKELLSFGEALEVIAPQKLKLQITKRIKQMMCIYHQQ